MYTYVYVVCIYIYIHIYAVCNRMPLTLSLSHSMYMYSALFGDMMGIPCHVYLIVSTHVQRIEDMNPRGYLRIIGDLYLDTLHVTCHGQI